MTSCDQIITVFIPIIHENEKSKHGEPLRITHYKCNVHPLYSRPVKLHCCFCSMILYYCCIHFDCNRTEVHVVVAIMHLKYHPEYKYISERDWPSDSSFCYFYYTTILLHGLTILYNNILAIIVTLIIIIVVLLFM